ncbi:uncharacterized protein TRIADDRAFT_32659 [Trichoplax adhaerens]|uniref:Fucosyltransferase n=1 Tax=Trichoplax adhaerens TaxID=10228 RepID=B3SBA6_TRIAD|nr:hypothetical protein TRIADDRAFT_32659 [Trichoplax adhaerens]EDV19968.1 hypothetical protein TRIADDRAFT_32659 [Trichoplax adhaerens]|eukprot:XP_002117558.1 hypothetical protein TRIADDRAFT_32659 [Trichoplax adhaerens]
MLLKHIIKRVNKRVKDSRNETIKTSTVMTAKPLRVIRILYWTGLFFNSWPEPLGYHSCGLSSVQCHFTSDRNYYSSADAVLFHGNDINILQDTDSLPNNTVKPPFQRWIYYTLESPLSLKLDQKPLLKEFFNNTFDWIMNYMKEVDLPSPYGYVTRGRYHNGFSPNIKYAANRSRMIAIVSSECYPHRMHIIRALQNYTNVDVFGRCGQKCPRNKHCWQHIQSNYKFYLSLENSVCNGYLTEKTYRNAFENNLIPIIISGANYSDWHVLPPQSFIDALKFANVRELANYIEKVASNDKLYNSYFQWRENYNIHLRSLRNSLCNVCKKIARIGNKGLQSSPYRDLSYTLGPHEDNCKEYPDPYLLYNRKIKFQFHRNKPETPS